MSGGFSSSDKGLLRGQRKLDKVFVEKMLKEKKPFVPPNPKAKNVRGTGVGAQPKFHTGDLSVICLSEICSSL